MYSIYNITIDDEYAPDNMRIGVAIVRQTRDGYLPEWARKLPSPIPQGTVPEMMRDPWLRPLSGDKSSTIVDWEEGFEYLLQFPLQAGDRLAIVAKLDDSPAKLRPAARFSVTLQVEYEHEHEHK